MEVKIKNKVIVEPIINILRQAQRELSNGKLKDIQDAGHDNIKITCPCHKSGRESKPSCQVLTNEQDDKLSAGYAHCFTCGYKATLPQLISDLFDEPNISFGEDWLVERFGNVFLEREKLLPKIELNTSTKRVNPALDEKILLQYDFYHDYMWKRKLTKEVVDEFRIGYDKERDAITFPVYDEKHRLVMITERCVHSKMFFIPYDVEKPVYLLYNIIEKNFPIIYVCESQINALTLRTWGYPSVALFGTGTPKQYELLKKSGVRNFVLCLDGDDAGRKGMIRFKKNMPNDIFIREVILPEGKDINDITKSEFEILLSRS